MSATLTSPESRAADPFLHRLRMACLERAGIDVRFLAGMPALRRRLAELAGAPATERLSVITRLGSRAQSPAARAGTTRVIVPPEVATGHQLDRLLALAEEGVDVRVSDRAARRLAVVDRRTALVELSATPGRGGSEAVCINNPALIRRVVSHYEETWGAATPLTGSAPFAIGRFTNRQRRVLDLLASGLTDEQVSQELGLTSRSIRSEMASIRQVLGAQSRFEAGMKYAELLRA